MPARKYRVNDSFFDNIDTEQKAYCLGLFCADGYYSTRDPRQLGIDLDSEDMDVLEQFKKALEFEGPIRKASGTMRRIQWTSQQHVTQLQNIGVVRCKTTKLGHLRQRIPPPLQRHFARGYFDGDGGWVWSLEGDKSASSYRRKLSVSIRGTPTFCRYLNSMLLTPARYYFSITGILRIKKQLQVLEFGDWLYAGATVYMGRKKKEYTAQRVALLREIQKGKILGNQSGSPAGITHRKQSR